METTTKDMITKRFASNLRRLRTERLWTQDDLVDKLGVGSGATISKWEAGRSLPRKETLRKVCELFDVTVDEILGFADSPAEGRGPAERTEPNRKSISTNVSDAFSEITDMPGQYSDEGRIDYTLVDSRYEPYFLPGDQLVVRTNYITMLGECLLKDEDISPRPFVAMVHKIDDDGTVTFSTLDPMPKLHSKANVEIIGKVTEFRRFMF